MKYGRKTIAFILSLMMILTMMPAMAFAEDADDASEAAAEEMVMDTEVTEEDQAVQEEAAAEDTEEAVIEDTEEQPEEEAVVEETADPAVEDAEEAPSEEEFTEEQLIEDTEGDDADVPEYGYQELTITQRADIDEIEEADPERMAENFFYSNDETTAESNPGIVRPLSVKGDRLTGTDLAYYNGFKAIVKKVASAKSSVTTKNKVALTTILGKRTFTAKELGVSQVGYVSNGTWYVTSAAERQVVKLLSPKNFQRVFYALVADTSSQSFWADWYGAFDYDWDCAYTYDYNSITFLAGDSMTFKIPVSSEFASGTYKTSISKIISAKTAKENAKAIVTAFNNNNYIVSPPRSSYSYNDVDVNRLYYYAKRVVELTDYDDYAAIPSNNATYTGPWGIMYVFDGNSSTKAVCAGYARAYKYLCDLSKFKSSWIDCQIVTGPVDMSDPDNSNHMWCIVRMNDGQNYVVDPTWMDNGGSSINKGWFLRGDPNGTSSRYTIEANTRGYDERTMSAFAPAERKLSTNSYYISTTSKKLVLKKSWIRRLTRGKASIKVLFKKITDPIGAVYIDGYQIQYSRRKDFRGGTTVKVNVKGYNKTAKTIKKLKRGVNYYVRIRTYAKLGGKTYYSAWSKKAKVKTK